MRSSSSTTRPAFAAKPTSTSSFSNAATVAFPSSAVVSEPHPDTTSKQFAAFIVEPNAAAGALPVAADTLPFTAIAFEPSPSTVSKHFAAFTVEPSSLSFAADTACVELIAAIVLESVAAATTFKPGTASAKGPVAPNTTKLTSAAVSSAADTARVDRVAAVASDSVATAAAAKPGTASATEPAASDILITAFAEPVAATFTGQQPQNESSGCAATAVERRAVACGLIWECFCWAVTGAAVGSDGGGACVCLGVALFASPEPLCGLVNIQNKCIP